MILKYWQFYITAFTILKNESAVAISTPKQLPCSVTRDEKEESSDIGRKVFSVNDASIIHVVPRWLTVYAFGKHLCKRIMVLPIFNHAKIEANCWIYSFIGNCCILSSTIILIHEFFIFQLISKSIIWIDFLLPIGIMSSQET